MTSRSCPPRARLLPPRAIWWETLSHQGVTILVLHDFDKAGIEILDKFQLDTRRYAYDNDLNVIDLGLRLVDAQAME